MKGLIEYFSERQKTLFLIDCLGAFVTAFFLFAIIRHYDEYFGMPKRELTYLSGIAVCFGIYSISCFLFLKVGLVPFFRIIGVANLIYCIMIIGLLVKYYSLITIVGTTYFLIEIVVICLLSYVELNVATDLKK